MAKRDTLYQIHLNGPGNSGRGVRVRRLRPSEKRASDLDATKAFAKDMSSTASTAERIRLGTLRCIVEVTEQDELETLQGEHVLWHTLTLQELEDDNGKYSVDEIFTALDVEMLENWYWTQHEPTQDMARAVLGKALQVATK